MSLYLDALDYASHGRAVFPLNGKVPYTANGFKDAVSIDINDGQSAIDAEHTIHAWWTRWPNANIGMVVPDSIIILDVDPRNGGSMAALGDMPPTHSVLSGRGDGGLHLYYARPKLLAGCKFVSTRLPAGIDLKHNGYVVVPPSIHPESGMPYVEIKRRVVRLPDRLKELIVHTPPVKRPAAHGDNDGKGLVEFVGKALEGNRNNALFWAACTARTEGTLPDLAEQLIEAAVKNHLSEFEARRTVASAERGD